MEYKELEGRLDEIHDKLVVARDEAQAGLELVSKLTHELGVPGVISGKFSVREMATKSPLVARYNYI